MLELRFFVQKQQEAEVMVQMLVHCAHISQTAKFRHSYSLFREVASPGGWGKQAREMYCKRRFSVFMEGWVQLLIWSIWEQDTPERGHNVMGGAGCTAGSECTTTTLVYSRNKATNQVWTNQEIKTQAWQWAWGGWVSSTGLIVCYCFLHTWNKRKYNTFE